MQTTNADQSLFSPLKMHALSCPTGGFPIICHNEIRDLTASLMTEVCHSVLVEPVLQPLSGEQLFANGAVTTDEARADIQARGRFSG